MIKKSILERKNSLNYTFTSNEQNENQSLAIEYDSTNLWPTVNENIFYGILSGMMYTLGVYRFLKLNKKQMVIVFKVIFAD